MSIPGQRRCDRADHIGHAFAYRRLVDCIICPHKLKRFAACFRILDLAIGGAAIIKAACHPPQRAAHRRLQHVIKEINHRNIEDLAHVPQARSADPVGAALIFLDLLESAVELGTKLLCPCWRLTEEATRRAQNDGGPPSSASSPSSCY